MLELILTRIDERALVQHAGGLRFLVFDELHTYRGRQGSDVAMLIRRCREAFGSRVLQCVGTSATMVSVGTSVEQAQVVADVASTIFGQTVLPEHVIGETILRTTTEYDFTRDEVRVQLGEVIQRGAEPPGAFEELRVDPLASWIEGTFGIQREQGTGRLIRQSPQPLEGEYGVAVLLAKVTGRSESESRSAIERYLYAGSRCENPTTGFPLFAFRLHQFITRGDTAWATLEPEAEREIALRGQKYVPGDRSRILLPLVFCRACGHPYYRVERPRGGQTGPIEPRESYGISVAEDVESGYLYLSSEHPWTGEAEDILDRVPEDWIEIHREQPRIKRHVQKQVPEVMRIPARWRSGCRRRGGGIHPSSFSLLPQSCVQGRLLGPPEIRRYQTRNDWCRWEEHGDDGAGSDGNADVTRRSDAGARGQETAEFHGQPTGCVPPSRPFQ